MVEWKKLSEICEIKGEYGLSVPSKPFDGVRYIRITDITDDGKLNSDCVSADYNEITKVPLEEGDLLFARTGATVGKTLMYLKEYGKCLYAGYLIRYRVNREVVLPKYVFHFTHSNKYNLWVKSNLVEGAQPNINAQKYNSLEIPIPSLQAQSRIVSILDTFTSSISNLKQQIEERRKQYEYERDLLLDLEGKEGVEMKTIQDVCRKICSGGTPSTSHKEYYEGNIPWLRTQEVDWKEINDTEIKITEEAIANSSAKLIAENCVIVAMYGATAAKVAINKIPLSTNQACCNLEIDNTIASFKYVYHWLCKEYQNLKSMGEGSQNNINGQKVKNYPIPIPPLSTQSRIVSILDTFEQSIANLEEQLAMREKQYEYYREKLLRFEEA